VKRLKTSSVMQSKTSRNNKEEFTELQGGTACQGKYPVTRIANGLCENLRNVRKHRLLMQEEINQVLGRLLFATDRSLPALTGIRDEE